MKRSRLFLSRATGEFGRLTAEIRANGQKAFSHLELHDQENPPSGQITGQAKITAQKIYQWVRESRYVFHYVGFDPGGTAKLPANIQEDEIGSLKQVVDPRSQRYIDSLVTAFQAKNLKMTDITYTQLEGVIAIALHKEPLVFWLDGDPSQDVVESQMVYREWLRTFYLQGRDRIASQVVDDFRTASFRSLNRLNRELMLEALVRDTAETPLWETFYTLAQPDTTEAEIQRQVQGIRNWQGSRHVEWIDQLLEFGGLAAPPYVLKGVSLNDAVVRWLIPFEKHVAQVSLDLSSETAEWRNTESDIPGSGFRSACFDDNQFQVLSESSGKYQLTAIGNEGTPHEPSVMKIGEGSFATHSFEPIQLLRAEQKYHLVCSGNTWLLEKRSDESDGLWAVSVQQLPEQATSGLISQFPERSEFPLSRHFRGEVYDGDFREPGMASTASSSPAWAMVRSDDRFYCVTLRDGDFLDLFQTVDLYLDGNWKLLDVQNVDNVALIRLKYSGENGALPDDEFILVPLFPRKGLPNEWSKETSKLLLLQRDGDPKTSQVTPQDRSALEPFCFVRRAFCSSEDSTASTTRLQVWLIPERWEAGLISRIKAYLCDLKPLPRTPIVDVGDLENVPFADEWWGYLWHNCHPWDAAEDEPEGLPI